MYEIAARLVGRPDDMIPGQVNLILGAAFRDQTFFKPDRVYEIRVFDGAPMIVDVGPAVTGVKDNCIPGASWNNSVDQILDCSGKHLFLTRDEYGELCQQENHPE